MNTFSHGQHIKRYKQIRSNPHRPATPSAQDRNLAPKVKFFRTDPQPPAQIRSDPPYLSAQVSANPPHQPAASTRTRLCIGARIHISHPHKPLYGLSASTRKNFPNPHQPAGIFRICINPQELCRLILTTKDRVNPH